MLIDSHCHLDCVDLSKHGRVADVITTAKQRGVEGMLCVNIDLEHRLKVLHLAETFPEVVASVGVHPMYVQTGISTTDELIEWGSHPKIVAFGETGLDYYYGDEHLALQQESFVRHLHAGTQASLPVIVHTRGARQDTLALIREHASEQSAGVLHCFTEDWAMAKKAIDYNFCISVAGIVTFKNAAELRDVVKKVPLDRLLVETDSPYLAPVPYRGKQNEPAYVREVAEFIAQLKGISFAELAAITSENFFRLFPKAAAHLQQ